MKKRSLIIIFSILLILFATTCYAKKKCIVNKSDIPLDVSLVGVIDPKKMNCMEWNGSIDLEIKDATTGQHLYNVHLNAGNSKSVILYKNSGKGN